MHLYREESRNFLELAVYNPTYPDNGRYYPIVFINPQFQLFAMSAVNKKNPKVLYFRTLLDLHLKEAVRTGLEPVTPCVTGMYSNQLN